MSENLRRYRTIHEALRTMGGVEPRGNYARHLATLAGLISGIIGAQHTQLPKVAGRVPDQTKPASRVKRFERWIDNANLSWELYFLPFVDVLLASLVKQTLVLVIDGSPVGRGCLGLMVSVVYQGRALPLMWLVVNGKKGHFAEHCHLQLLRRVYELIPPGADVVWVGDGEFDGVGLQQALNDCRWRYVCRTGKNICLYEADEELHFGELPLLPGDVLSLPGVSVTEARYGPVHALGWWGKGYKEPIYLVTNFELAEEACFFYRKRFRIETFFSDQKSRGFRLHKSHIADPERLARLLIATCLAYLWLIYLGRYAQQQGWQGLIHRPDRCDLSLFQLGLRLLEYLLSEQPENPVPVDFAMPVATPGCGELPLILKINL